CAADCTPPGPGACTPPPEVCNGIDDDCDGETDEGFPCRQGAIVPCTTICGSTGSGACTASCQIPAGAACTPPPEVCNARDDDCDTRPDNGFACVGGSTQTCVVGSCIGTQTCGIPACTWNACNFGTPPANDACGGTIPDISGGGTFVGSTCAANNDYTASCGATAASPDVVFSLTLAGAADVTLDTVGSDYDAVLHVRSGATCPGATETACDDNSAGGTPGQARIMRRLAAGTYWVIVDGAGAGSRGSFTLNVTVTATPTPPNDTCAGAIDITAGGVFSGSTATATDDHMYAGCPFSATGGRDVWYTFTIESRQVIYLDTVDGNRWDTVLQIRQGSCPSPATAVVCADDQCGSYSGGLRSQIVRVLDAGTYYVVVDGYSSTSAGNFALRFQRAPCAAAGQITGNGNYDGTTVGQGNDSAGACGGSGAPDYMYYFGLCGARGVTATTCNAQTNFDTVIYFRSGNCDAASEVACNDNNPLCAVSTLRSTVTASLSQGLNFAIVDGFSLAAGAYRLTISGM
ncbi:MAG: hypothetical protein QME96_07825, partial [Myxococcota bacterium]|nr:hypothetical protein [Myxococcota bacterium]